MPVRFFRQPFETAGRRSRRRLICSPLRSHTCGRPPPTRQRGSGRTDGQTNTRVRRDTARLLVVTRDTAQICPHCDVTNIMDTPRRFPRVGSLFCRGFGVEDLIVRSRFKPYFFFHNIALPWKALNIETRRVLVSLLVLSLVSRCSRNVRLFDNVRALLTVYSSIVLI